MFRGSHFEIFNTRSASAKSGTETTEVWDRPENSQILGGSRSLTDDNNIRAPSRPRAISVISVLDLALADRALTAREFKIQKGPP